MELIVLFKISGIILLGEFIVHLVFHLVSRFIGKANRDKISRTSILKGLIERAFVVLVLYFNLTSALTLLGALKIATRIRDAEDKVSNDFFVLGNLISVIFGILYFVIINNLIGR